MRLDAPIVAGRVPPHNLDAEAAVLSAILLDRIALAIVISVLKPEHFYSDANGRIFEAALELSAQNEPVDVVTVAVWLRGRERLSQTGGAAYLAQLADATPAVAHVEAHAALVVDTWRLRQLIARCQVVAAEGYGDVGNVREFIKESVGDLETLAAQDEKKGLEPVTTSLKAGLQEIQAAADRGDRISGTSTGFEKLDAKMAGLHDGDLTIIAARPGMGKTSLAMDIAMNVAAAREELYQDPENAHRQLRRMVKGKGVFFFSLEQPTKQLAIRMACAEARVDLGKVRGGYLQAADWAALTEAMQVISGMPIWLDGTSSLGMLELRAKVRQKKAVIEGPGDPVHGKVELGLLVVDYLQLMKGRDGAQNREQEIAETSRGLKELAKEMEVPVIALSQLNRAVETRPGKDRRPQLSDLRESGAIEQDADNIIFIYRDEYYNPEDTKAKGIAELLISKQRNGPTGKVLVRYTSSCTHFANLAVGDYPELED